MPLEVKSVFEGIDHNAANWVKHYLTPGTDVSLEWNGIPDSVSGDTYKYSNQFDFNVTTNSLQYLYGYSATLAETTSNVYAWNGISGQLSYTIVNGLNNLDEVSLWRLPLPDLPGVLLLHSTVGYNIGGQTFNLIGVPIFDPNWKPTMFGMVFDMSASPHVLIHCNSMTVGSNKFPVGTYGEPYQVMSGYADNLTGYRLAGASVTVTNTSAPLYRNGTIVACNADTPLSRPYEVSVDELYTKKADINLCSNLLNVVDAPVSYEAISSVKNYHKFEMKEGVYCVLHNLQGTFLSRNPEIDRIPPVWNASTSAQVASVIMNTDNSTFIPLLFIISDNNGYTSVPLVYTQADHAKYYHVSNDTHTLFVPHPFIDPSSLSLWNSAFISFNMTDINQTLNLSMKFNTYIECYVASHSALKPNVSKSCRFHPSLIEYTSEFYSYHDGIYVAADNDSGAVWEVFKKSAADFANNVLKQTPYYPVAKAGFDLVKDLVGGGIKVTKETPQKHQAKQQQKAAKKEAKDAVKKMTANQMMVAQGVIKPKKKKAKKQPQQKVSNKRGQQSKQAAREVAQLKAAKTRGKASKLAAKLVHDALVTQRKKNQFPLTKQKYLEILNRERNKVVIPSAQRLATMAKKGSTVLYDLLPVSRSSKAKKFLIDL